MVLGALGCRNNVDFGKIFVNVNVVLDVFIIYQKLQHILTYLLYGTPALEEL